MGEYNLAIFCESERLYLRDVELTDSSLLVKWKNDDLIRKMSIGLNAIVTQENQENDIKRSLGNEQLYLIIIVKDTKRPIGYVRINWLDDTKDFAWLRFGLGKERGKGYSKEALKALITELFKKEVHRIDAEVYKFNEISFKLLQSIGFKHEGTRREAYYENKNFADVLVLGLLKEDFRIKNNLFILDN